LSAHTRLMLRPVGPRSRRIRMVSSCATASRSFGQHRLYFSPLPHGQRSFRAGMPASVWWPPESEAERALGHGPPPCARGKGRPLRCRSPADSNSQSWASGERDPIAGLEGPGSDLTSREEITAVANDPKSGIAPRGPGARRARGRRSPGRRARPAPPRSRPGARPARCCGSPPRSRRATPPAARAGSCRSDQG
jgi:hypothetical protein